MDSGAVFSRTVTAWKPNRILELMARLRVESGRAALGWGIRP
jgi:hypothetical protein